LDLTSTSRPKKLGAGKGSQTQVAWEWQGGDPSLLGLTALPGPRHSCQESGSKANGFGIAVKPKAFGSGV